ncbi:MAG: hypothetical protein KF684_10720 [Phycisphaeraceae bacterium]|nr:hypothetical protein [Phycisphaeraceae bacterium]
MTTRPRPTLALLACAGLALAPHAPGQPGPPPARTLESLTPGARIDAARARVGDESLRSEDRLDAMRDLIDALEDRLERGDTPAETRVRDAIELAESIVSAMAWEGLLATASVGVLTSSMREQAEAGSQRALRAAARFDEARETVRAVDPALEARAALARSRAGITLALSTGDAETRRRAVVAASAIRAVPSLLREDEHGAAENAEAEAQRLLCLARLSLLEARALEARVSFTGARQIAQSPRAKAEAALGAALATAQTDGPREALRQIDALARDDAWLEIERADALASILRADAARRIALAQAEFADADALRAGAIDAARPYLDLAARGVAGAPGPALRSLLVEKAAASGGPLLLRLSREPSDASAFERVMRALARETGDDDALRAAILLPGSGVNAQALGAVGPFAGDALWRLGVSRSERVDDAAAQREAAALLLDFAQRFPDDQRAFGAIAGATASAQRVAIASPGDERAAALYERTLRAALDDPRSAGDARADAWRFELGRLLAAGGRDEEADDALAKVVAGALGVRAAELRLALAERAGDERRVAQRAADLERVAAGAGEDGAPALERARAVRAAAEVRAAAQTGDEQGAMRAAARLADADPARAVTILRAEASRLVESLALVDAQGEPFSESHRATARVAAALGRALVELSGQREGASDGDRVLLARAQRFLGDADAARESAASIERVMQRVGRVPELLAEYAEALRVAGDQPRAFGAYRELSNATRPDDPRTRAFHWLAWGRMLEILSAQNSDGTRSATIRAQGERLRLIDPSLGGPPHRGRIERAIESAR